MFTDHDELPILEIDALTPEQQEAFEAIIQDDFNKFQSLQHEEWLSHRYTAEGKTVLHTAALNGHVDIVEFILGLAANETMLPLVKAQLMTEDVAGYLPVEYSAAGHQGYKAKGRRYKIRTNKFNRITRMLLDKMQEIFPDYSPTEELLPYCSSSDTGRYGMFSRTRDDEDADSATDSDAIGDAPSKVTGS